MKRDFRRRKQGPSPLFPRQTRVRIRGAAMGGIILFGNAPRYPLPLLLPHGGSRLGSDGGKADGRLKARAAGTVCLQTRAVARRRFQTSGRRHRNRSGGFCCFSPSKSREKIFLLYFWGPKYQKPPHVVLRGIARAAALHGARKIRPMCHPVADAPQPAPSFSASNESADSWCRQRRHRVKYQFTPTASFHLLFLESVFLFSARRFPTWFRWRKSGRRAESDSGGDGLLANPRTRPTPLSAFRTPTSESVGWLLLLFATEKQRKKKKFSARRPKIAKGFRENFCCCFSPPKSREKEKRLFMYF